MSPRSSLYLACWVVAAVTALVVSGVALVTRRPLSTPVVSVDVLIAVGVLALSAWVVAPDHRVGTWVAFQTGYALSVVITATTVRSLTVVAWGLPAALGAYLFQVSEVSGSALGTTVAGNLLTFVVYAVLCRLVLTFVRRVGEDADQARARAAELARREEQRRAQVVMHNGAAVLRLLTEPDLPPAARSALVDQAMVELEQMRSYLRPAPAPVPGDDVAGTVRLADSLAATCARFPDLRVERVPGPGADVEVDAVRAHAVARALDSLLLNVREHAGADHVVVHLEADAARTWTLTVHDDGAGFDPAAVTAGVGLREVVVGELTRHGMDVTVDSRPGEGTTVTVRGTATAPAPAPAPTPAGRARTPRQPHAGRRLR
ncbi:ATP-binding protein [Xylanimonas oleitrophica]|uniref:ATP-binding protein n=2 Tax=Xylanimonas oleitrophica TaxID=2607479 RepID=A0A2W5WXZ2_9MICO|nr:ATP-binding protein [Xylanimonas oleitrophica]